MKNPLFQGVATALVTPFRDGKVNIPMFHRLLDRQLEAGVKTQVVCGTTGEAPTLTEEEKLLLFREAKNHLDRNGTLIAGTGCNCTEQAVRLSVAAQDQGADALLLVTPYYNKATASGLIRHYTAIAEAVRIPVLLYNVPSRTGVDIPLNVYQELSQIPNIAGVKEASPNLEKLAEIRRTCREEFALYSGNDSLLLPVLSVGGEGVISVASNAVPREMREITDAWACGDFSSAREKFLNLLPLMKALFSEVNPIPIKGAMKILGFDCGDCRLPLTPLSESHRLALAALLKT